MRITDEMIAEDEKRWHARDVVMELDYCSTYMCDRKDITNLDIRFYAYIMRKARDLLKAQEPRVLTLDELRSLDGTDHFVWLEDNGEYDLYDCYAEVTTYQNNVELNTFGREVEFEPDNEEYGKTWRCWSARPSDAQRRAVKWDE